MVGERMINIILYLGMETKSNESFQSINNYDFSASNAVWLRQESFSFLLQDDIPGEYFQYPLSYTAGYFLPPSWEQFIGNSFSQ